MLSVATHDRKPCWCLTIALNNKTGPLCLEISWSEDTSLLSKKKANSVTKPPRNPYETSSVLLWQGPQALCEWGWWRTSKGITHAAVHPRSNWWARPANEQGLLRTGRSFVVKIIVTSRHLTSELVWLVCGIIKYWECRHLLFFRYSDLRIGLPPYQIIVLCLVKPACRRFLFDSNQYRILRRSAQTGWRAVNWWSK